MADNPAPSKLEARKIYLKDASFESPGAPLIFVREQTQPQIDMHLAINHEQLQGDQDFYEVVLKITVTAKIEEQVAFLVEIEQAGVFSLQHPEADKLEIMKEVACPHMLLPFAREEINTLVTKGGFQQFLIAPVNFEALYIRKKQQNQAAQADETAQPH